MRARGCYCDGGGGVVILLMKITIAYSECVRACSCKNAGK